MRALRFRSTLAASVAALLALAGCSAGAGPDGTESSGGTLNLGLVAEPASLDFSTDDGAAIPQILLTNVYETLVNQAQDGSIVPGLAEKWTVSDDAKTYDFTLRSGVTFSDGTPFTADDAVFSIGNVKDHWTVGVARVMDAVESVTAVSPTELKVVLSEPNALWLFKMTTRIGAMMSAKHADKLATEAIGTGPFTVGEWKHGVSITLNRNDSYWGEKAKEKSVVFKYYKDAVAMNNALLTGDIDVITTVQAPEALDQFKDASKYTVINGTTNGKVMMTLNNASPALSDVRVRQAVNYALDKEAIVKGAWAGYGTPIGSHEVPTDPWFVDLADKYPHDVAKAKELLKEAGKTNLTLTLSVPNLPYAQAAAPIIVSQLADAGITVKTESLTFPDGWVSKVFKAPYDYDLTIINHVEQYDLTTVFSGTPDYYTQYTNPEVTRLEAEGLAGDQDTFIADFKKVVTILADDAAAAWLWAFPNLMVADANVHGLPENAIGEALSVAGLYTD